MHSDNAAVALADAHANVEELQTASRILDYLATKGWYLCGWNHDMSQAPRDGTVIDLIAGGRRWPDCYWHVDEANEDIGWYCFYQETSGGSSFRISEEPTAWCHLMPPPKVGV